MQIAPDDAGLWFLKGKMLIFKRDPAAAAALHRAVASGLEEARVLAYLGQLAFEQRDYPEVRRIFSSLSEAQYAPRLKQAVKYWSGRSSGSMVA
jgi:cytochrome c-type biogenesis protein CcmH/NrfG